MVGYHVIGKKGVKLMPGVNDIEDSIAIKLIDQGIVTDAAGTPFAKKTEEEKPQLSLEPEDEEDTEDE